MKGAVRCLAREAPANTWPSLMVEESCCSVGWGRKHAKT